MTHYLRVLVNRGKAVNIMASAYLYPTRYLVNIWPVLSVYSIQSDRLARLALINQSNRARPNGVQLFAKGIYDTGI